MDKVNKKRGRRKQKTEGATKSLLEQPLEQEKKRSEEYLNQLKYLQADFENYKKRVNRQIEEIKRYCNEKLVLELLEVVDE